MVIIGADVSGNTTGGGQSRHVAIVVGTEESVNKIHRKIGVAKIHMSHLSDSKKQKVFRELKFNDDDLLGLCLNVERQKTIDCIIDNVRQAPINKEKSRIHRHFDHLLWRAIRDKVESFAYLRHYEIEDIVMQCDSDMIKTGENWKMKTAIEGKAHEIADAVAWCNERNKPIKHCLNIDLANKLLREMRHDLLN